MFTNNPYAQAGWHNPENPLSINNGTWGSQSPPQPSIYGALPHAVPASPPTIITFHFVSFNPSILNSTVVGPQGRRYYSISTSSPDVGASSLFYNHENQNMASIEWHQQPIVQIRDTVQRKFTSQWLALSPDQSYRAMEIKGKWYAWVPKDDMINLFTVSPNQPELLARVTRDKDSIKMEVTAQAVQTGLLDAAVVAVVLLYSRRNLG